MSKIIGPIDRATWNTMLTLKGVVAYDKSQNNPKLKKNIEWMENEFQKYLDGALGRAA